MWRIVILFSIASFFVFVEVENKGIRIPLVRQKSPREIGMNMINKGEGLNFDWLKPHPPHNRTNDSIALFRFLDNEFYGIINIGKPGKQFKALFATTWGDSYVYSKDCNVMRKIGCWFHHRYDHDQSSTYTENGTIFTLNLGKDNITGYFSSDRFSIAHLRVENQTFVELTDVPWYHITSKADGLMGMGYSSLGKSTPFFYNLIQQNKLKNPLFSVYINRDRSSNRGGNIILGAIENKHIHYSNNTYDNITYLPINTKNGYWEYKQDRITLDNGHKTYIYCKDGCNAIADTSSMTIVGPKAEIELINRHLDATLLVMGRYQINCDTIQHLPHIGFTLKGKTFVLTANDFVQKVTVNAVTICLSAFTYENGLAEENLWVMGAAFLGQYYSIYDFGKNRIGFVRAA